MIRGYCIGDDCYYGGVENKKYDGFYIKLYIDKNKKIHVIENQHKNYNEMELSRHPSTIKMFEKLYSKFDDLPTNITFYINTNDNYEENMLNYFGQISIPDFNFEHWPTAKLPKFYDLYDKQPFDFDDKKDKLLWIGNINTHGTRINIYEKYKNYDKFEIISMNWENGPYKSMEEHSEYKYLLDIRGAGWSGRLKYILLLNSVIFIVDRCDTCKEYWFEEFVPWVDYVPVKEDGSDLIENFNIMFQDQEKSRTMAQSCYNKAKNVFSEENVYNHFKICIKKYNTK